MYIAMQPRAPSYSSRTPISIEAFSNKIPDGDVQSSLKFVVSIVVMVKMVLLSWNIKTRVRIPHESGAVSFSDNSPASKNQSRQDSIPEQGFSCQWFRVCGALVDSEVDLSALADTLTRKYVCMLQS
jgi:hypothetical protein